MFFKNPDEVNDLKAKARHDEEILKKGGRDIVDAAKARADDTYRQGEAKFDKLKAIHVVIRSISLWLTLL